MLCSSPLCCTSPYHPNCPPPPASILPPFDQRKQGRFSPLIIRGLRGLNGPKDGAKAGGEGGLRRWAVYPALGLCWGLLLIQPHPSQEPNPFFCWLEVKRYWHPPSPASPFSAPHSHPWASPLSPSIFPGMEGAENSTCLDLSRQHCLADLSWKEWVGERAQLSLDGEVGRVFMQVKSQSWRVRYVSGVSAVLWKHSGNKRSAHWPTQSPVVWHQLTPGFFLSHHNAAALFGLIQPLVLDVYFRSTCFLSF